MKLCYLSGDGVLDALKDGRNSDEEGRTSLGNIALAVANTNGGQGARILERIVLRQNHGIIEER